MMTETQPGLPVTRDDEELHHWTCCDDGIAVCGLDVSKEAPCGGKCRNTPCPLCRLVLDEGLPCTIPGCQEE
jgi:hypothetical protein